MHRRTLLHHWIRCATHVYKDLFECNFTVNILNICIICQPENQISLKSKVRMILGTTKKQPCIMRKAMNAIYSSLQSIDNQLLSKQLHYYTLLHYTKRQEQLYCSRSSRHRNSCNRCMMAHNYFHGWTRLIYWMFMTVFSVFCWFTGHRFIMSQQDDCIKFGGRVRTQSHSLRFGL